MGASAVLLWPYKPDDVKVLGFRRTAPYISVVVRGRLQRKYSDERGVAGGYSFRDSCLDLKKRSLYAAVLKHAGGVNSRYCFSTYRCLP